jgi:hypothetical protein
MTATFSVIRWRDAFHHSVHVRVEGGKITGVEAAYEPWRGRELAEVLRHLAGYSTDVRVKAAGNKKDQGQWHGYSPKQ